MSSPIKKPIGFTLGLLGFGILINTLLDQVLFIPYLKYAIGSLIAVTFTFLFDWLLQVQLSKHFRYRASSYVALLMFIVSVIAVLGALYYKPELVAMKGQVETMPPFMVALIGIGSSVWISVIYWGILYLLLSLGNWLASFVVKSKEVL